LPTCYSTHYHIPTAFSWQRIPRLYLPVHLLVLLLFTLPYCTFSLPSHLTTTTLRTCGFVAPFLFRACSFLATSPLPRASCCHASATLHVLYPPRVVLPAWFYTCLGWFTPHLVTIYARSATLQGYRAAHVPWFA